MSTKSTVPPPRFIDRIRGLINKMFGRPGRKPHHAKPLRAALVREGRQ
jgi:hypothetical protein